MIRIAQHLLLLLVAVSTANAAFLYFGEGFFGVRGNLYVLDTTTNRVSVVGTVRDADGNTYGTNAMHYMSSTGLIYAVPSGRSSNSTAKSSIIAIDPATAQGSFSSQNVIHYFGIYIFYECVYSPKLLLCLDVSKHFFLIFNVSVVQVGLCPPSVTQGFTWQNMAYDPVRRIFLLGLREKVCSCSFVYLAWRSIGRLILHYCCFVDLIG
jgi:hypothetical protein